MERARWSDRFVDWFDDRYDVRFRVFDRLAAARFPAGSSWGYRFGLLALVAIVLQLVTGLFLLLEYTPTVEGAQPSLRRIAGELRYGWLIHALHVLGASLAIAFGGLYLFGVVLRRLYKKPRELNWAVLVLAFGAILAMAYSGSILPWNDRSIAAATVGYELTSRVPVLGPGLADLLYGGPDPGGWTLRRALTFHLVVGPALLAGLIGGYWRLVRTTGHEPVEE